MSNNWQSLGAVARPGADGDQKKKIVVYVGSDNSNAKVDIDFYKLMDNQVNINGNNNFDPGRHEISNTRNI